MEERWQWKKGTSEEKGKGGQVKMKRSKERKEKKDWRKRSRRN
jgi:hypothetical protein